MVREIRLYVEGDKSRKKRDSDINLRKGFHTFFKEVIDKARAKNIKWNTIPCGAGAVKAFKYAIGNNPEAFNILLIDSEGPVSNSPKEFITNKSRYNFNDVEESRFHLMIELMESWFVADKDGLSEFYGKGFRRSSLPRRKNVEKIPKSEVLSSIRNATKDSKKGKYHKTRHAPRILCDLNTEKIRETAPHCNRLFETLIEAIS